MQLKFSIRSQCNKEALSQSGTTKGKKDLQLDRSKERKKERKKEKRKKERKNNM